MELTRKKAKELSIKKWEFIVKHNGSEFKFILVKEIPELKDLEAKCGYCEKYFDNKHCNYCPIKPKGFKGSIGCLDNQHPYDKWDKDRTTKNAQAVLDLIRNS